MMIKIEGPETENPGSEEANGIGNADEMQDDFQVESFNAEHRSINLSNSFAKMSELNLVGKMSDHFPSHPISAPVKCPHSYFGASQFWRHGTTHRNLSNLQTFDLAVGEGTLKSLARLSQPPQKLCRSSFEGFKQQETKKLIFYYKLGGRGVCVLKSTKKSKSEDLLSLIFSFQG